MLLTVGIAKGGQDLTRAIKLSPGQELAMASFSLSEDSELTLRSDRVLHRIIDLTTNRSGVLFSVCWIIDARTREKIWSEREEDRVDQRDGPFKLRLPKGEYEMYLAMVRRDPGSVEGQRLRTPPILPGKQQPRFAISGVQSTLSFPDREPGRDALDKALVTINRVRNDSSETRMFQVLADAQVRIYAVGEARRRSSSVFDYGWIEDLTRDRIVWSMNPRECEFAGGSRKNIAARDTITLKPGKYALHFESDDTHAFGDWTEEPPNDPIFWGITLWPRDESETAKFKILKERVLKAPVLAMIEVGNNRDLVKGMQVKQPIGLRIVCQGEGTWQDGMVDYGWITNIDTGKTVWSMKFQDTVHGGGAEKNRLINKLVNLDVGRYLVHYRTDDSHAFGDWNSPPPIRPSSWGITIYALEQKDTPSVQLFDEVKSENKPLVALRSVGNSAYLEKWFSLTALTRLQVVAMGEGNQKALQDHGWIENDDSGRIVWKMDPAKTVHAGGGLKNRLQVDTITLPPGNYKLLYESDDLHAFANWNVAPPNEPDKYGIALFVLKP